MYRWCSLAADTKFVIKYDSGERSRYDHKITGGFNGIRIGSTGDWGVFNTFTMTIQRLVNSTRASNQERFLSQRLPGLRMEPTFWPEFEEVLVKISEIQNQFYHKYENNRFRILMGIASSFFKNGQSTLYYFETDGRYTPRVEPVAIGSGGPYATYFLNRYWNLNQTTMEEFAQLSDFVIRHVSSPSLILDNSVGLSVQDDLYRYPQIVYVPDDPNFCVKYNNGQPKQDCSPDMNRLNEIRQNSENMLKMLNNIPAPWSNMFSRS